MVSCPKAQALDLLGLDTDSSRQDDKAWDWFLTQYYRSVMSRIGVISEARGEPVPVIHRDDIWAVDSVRKRPHRFCPPNFAVAGVPAMSHHTQSPYRACHPEASTNPKLVILTGTVRIKCAYIEYLLSFQNRAFVQAQALKLSVLDTDSSRQDDKAWDWFLTQYYRSVMSRIGVISEVRGEPVPVIHRDDIWAVDSVRKRPHCFCPPNFAVAGVPAMSHHTQSPYRACHPEASTNPKLVILTGTVRIKCAYIEYLLSFQNRAFVQAQALKLSVLDTDSSRQDDKAWDWFLTQYYRSVMSRIGVTSTQRLRPNFRKVLNFSKV